MRLAPGVGLAAPQVDVLERVIVVELPADEEEGRPAELYAFVNPEIVKTSRDIEEDEEGCLSIPGYVGEVPRHIMVIVRGQDARGKPQSASLRSPASSSTRLTTWMASCSLIG
jgi:peptide deformylase